LSVNWQLSGFHRYRESISQWHDRGEEILHRVQALIEFLDCARLFVSVILFRTWPGHKTFSVISRPQRRRLFDARSSTARIIFFIEIVEGDIELPAAVTLRCVF
jgi:hypothetical protein